MCQSQSVGSYKQAGEVSRMELQKAVKSFVLLLIVLVCV